MNREESIVFAQKFLEDILSFFGVNLAVYSTSEDQVIQLSVPSSELNSLFIGRDSGNLRALQFLVSRALESKNAEITRVSIDVADYKKQRAQKISQKAEKWIEQVRKTGEPYRLNLNPTDPILKLILKAKAESVNWLFRKNRLFFAKSLFFVRN